MTMNIQYLLDAAAFLESHSPSGLPLDWASSTPTWSQGGFSSASTSSSSVSAGLLSSTSGSSESSSSSRDGVENGAGRFGGAVSSGGALTPPASSPGAAEPKMPRRFKGKNSRETHNRLEKDRRAYLRECFANLRLVVDIEDPKCSNLAILQSAIRCIQGLKRREKQCERETAALAKRKIELQQKIGELKRELSERHPDSDFDVNLWLKMHVSGASSASAAGAAPLATSTTPTDASSDEAGSVHAWGYADRHSAPRRDSSPARSPLDAGAAATKIPALAPDAESTSTVSLDENSKEPIFSDEDEPPRRRHPEGRPRETRHLADAPAVAAHLALGLDGTPARAVTAHDYAVGATRSAVVVGRRRVGEDAATSARYHTVITEDPRPSGPEVVVKTTTSPPPPPPRQEAAQVLTSAGGQNVALMTPDGKLIWADSGHRLIRTAGSNLILWPPAGYQAYDVVREATHPGHHRPDPPS